MDVFSAIRKDARVEELIRLLQAGDTPVAAEGLWGSSAPMLAGIIAQRLDRPLLIATAHADEADDLRDDVETVTGATPELLPQLEALPQDTTVADELAAERLRLCVSLMSDGAQRGTGGGASSSDTFAAGPPMVVAPIMALMQPVPARPVVFSQAVIGPLDR